MRGGLLRCNGNTLVRVSSLTQFSGVRLLQGGAPAASERLNRFLNDCGIVDPRKVVHSLRHRAQLRLGGLHITALSGSMLTGVNQGGQISLMTVQMAATIVQAVATVLLGAFAGYIAWRQWRTSHDRLVLDFFERRFRVFQELTSAILEAFHKPNPQINDLAKFDVASEKARFLFRSSGGRKVENEISASLNGMHAFYGNLAARVTPYLGMATRS